MSATAPATNSFFFAALLIGGSVRDPSGDTIATIRDLIARIDLEAREKYPPLTGLVVSLSGREVFMPWALVGQCDQRGVRVMRAAFDLRRFERRPGEVLLSQDVLDKQLIDVQGRRVIRASDVILAQITTQVRVVGVDVGLAAILRRAAPRGMALFADRTTVIDWEDIEYLPGEAPDANLRGNLPKISRLHPVEIAQLIEDLPNRLGSDIIEALDDEVAADVVEELSEDRQGDIVEGMDPDRAADVLEEMEPDAAADVISELSDDAAADVLAEMDQEEADDVRELLTHREGTAGALMTTWFATIPDGLTATAALDYLRVQPDRPQFLHYIYVVDADDSEILRGVVGMSDLAMAPTGTMVVDIMESEPQTATPDMKIREVAEQMAEYNLIALPLLNEHQKLAGIVTVDDVMDELVIDVVSFRLPRLFG